VDKVAALIKASQNSTTTIWLRTVRCIGVFPAVYTEKTAIALIDHLNISKVAVVGWSDGGITGEQSKYAHAGVESSYCAGLNLAMNYTSRVDRVFAHGPNPQYNTSQPGLKDPIINSKDGSLGSTKAENGTTFSVNGLGLGKRNNIVGSPGAPYTCEHLSPQPDKCADMRKAVGSMWDSEPAWGPEAFAKITCPVWVVDGDHE
jgi:pimeloyl-ACP methyl ester carboxylesterase